jgi:aminodeoxyfutalosine deaminase
MRYLRDHQIPLEVCPTSNICTGAVTSLDIHPLRKLYDAGIPVTIATDDPGVFHCTLEGEFAIAERLGLSNCVRNNGHRFRFIA